MASNRQHELINDVSGTLDIEYDHYFRVDTRTEECHGYHQFEDVETLGVKVNRVILKYNDLEIDITDRLTKDEIKDIECELMP